MILYLASGVDAAIARITALAVDARFMVGTFAVLLAARWRWEHNATAFAVLIGHPEFGTFADHCTHRSAIQHTALGGLSARREFFARIHTLVTDAGQSAWTVQVNATYWLDIMNDAFAIAERIALWQIVGATAIWLMVSHEANGILSAWRIVIGGTWIDAVFVDACTITGAFVVGVAFDAFATFEGTTLEARRATAGGTMIVAETFGIHGTWIAQGAWIDTFTIVALLVVGAFVVRLAAQFDAAELSIARIAWFACAHWMMVCHVAFGVGTAVAWAHAKFVHTRFGEGTFGVRSTANGGLSSCKNVGRKNNSLVSSIKICIRMWQRLLTTYVEHN